MIRTGMKLTIELVPDTVWFKSLHNLLPRHAWEMIKKKVYEQEGRKCYICGATFGPLELHEFWQYDDERHVQKLMGLHHLCRLCHRIKHMGFYCHTEDGRYKLKREGLDRDDLTRHFCSVNRCTSKDFLQHEKEAFAVWAERSGHKWEQDLGEYSKHVRGKTLEGN